MPHSSSQAFLRDPDSDFFMNPAGYAARGGNPAGAIATPTHGEAQFGMAEGNLHPPGPKKTQHPSTNPAYEEAVIDLIATMLFCSGAVAALHESETVTDRRNAKDILGHVTESYPSRPSFAFLGDLCVLAVQDSSKAIRGIDFNFGKEPANSFTQDQHPEIFSKTVCTVVR
jgi:hypothetical protein